MRDLRIRCDPSDRTGRPRATAGFRACTNERSSLVPVSVPMFLTGHCGTPRRHKDACAIVVRTLFGTLQLPSPRWWHCPCQPQPRQTFRPLAVLLPERITPELCYLQAKFAALASYRVAATLLAELLPLGRPLHAAAVRRHAQAVAERLEDCLL